MTFTRKAIALRHCQPALRRGSYRTLYAEGQLYCFERAYQGEQLVIIFNISHDTVRFDLPIAGKQLIPLFAQQFPRKIESGYVKITLAPRNGVIWKVNR